MKTLFKTIFGSHLYGTDTPSSDTDIKGVFIESLDNIILGRAKKEDKQERKKQFGEKNTVDDTDIELKELRTFLKDCWTGQTYSLDLLFSPKEFWIVWTDEWRFILEHKDKLLSKNIQPYIGYCRRQAGKYGLKGSRLGELHRILEFFEKVNEKEKLIDHIDNIEQTEFVKRVTCKFKRNGEEVEEEYLEVLGKKFQFNRQIKHIKDSLVALDQRYGDRARLAEKNEGVDWKAISHAFRCCYQLIELAGTKHITFPLKEYKHVKEIKLGNLHYPDIQEELVVLMEKAVEAVDKSSLPEEPDVLFWEKWILDIYKKL